MVGYCSSIDPQTQNSNRSKPEWHEIKGAGKRVPCACVAQRTRTWQAGAGERKCRVALGVLQRTFAPLGTAVFAAQAPIVPAKVTMVKGQRPSLTDSPLWLVGLNGYACYGLSVVNWRSNLLRAARALTSTLNSSFCVCRFILARCASRARTNAVRIAAPENQGQWFAYAEQLQINCHG